MVRKLYHGEATRSARVLWLLAELGIEHETEAMKLSEVIQSTSFKAINPLRRVPFLIDGDVRMMESLAIMQYLAETYDSDGKLWEKPGGPERAEFLQWLNFSETIAVHIQILNQQINIIQPPEARSKVTIKLETRRLEKTIELVEGRLQGRDFLLDRGFTMADIAMGYSLVSAGDFTSLDPYENVCAYLKRLEDHPGFKIAHAGSLAA